MSSITKDTVRALCHDRVAALPAPEIEGVRLEQRVVHLVEENIKRGRFAKFAGGESNRTFFNLAEYVDRVVSCVVKEGPRIQALQDGDATEWNRLGNFLFTRAKPIVGRFRGRGGASADALDFAQKACLVVFEKQYPFDIPFDAWATTILNHLIIAELTRSGDALDRPQPPESLEDPPGRSLESGLPLSELLANPSALAPFEKIENQSLLLGAIDQLRSPAQQFVIIQSYLNQVEDVEIARLLGKTTQAVYNLRQRALLCLRKTIEEPPRDKTRRKPIPELPRKKPRRKPIS
ncbi:MAG: sigma-70 family RNA polymerase sigma factor [Chloroflexi bacterium]|nr:sigma-70 family RNA polymerase sigma factor [Chloroflexota bacterium]